MGLAHSLPRPLAAHTVAKESDVDQGTNRGDGITHASVAYPVAVEDLKPDLENRSCKRKRCKRAPQDDSEYCARCEVNQREYNRGYAKRRYDEWDKAGLCTRCGG